MQGSRLKPMGIFLLPLGLAFLVRGVFIWVSQSHPLLIRPVLDGEHYTLMANSFLAGRGACEGPYYACPLYIYFLAPFLKVFGPNWTLLRMVHGVLSLGAAAAITAVAWDLFGRKCAMWTFSLAVLYKPLVYAEMIVHKTSLSLFLGMTALCLLSKAKSRKACFVAGLLSGLSVACKSESGVVVAASLLWLLGWGYRKGALFLCLGAFLAVFPFSLRNVLVSGEFVPLTYSFGTNLYQGNNPQADGSGSMPDFVNPTPLYEPKSYEREAEKRLGRDLSPGQVSNYWAGEALRFMTQHPAQAVLLLGKKFLLYWNAQEVDDNLSYDFAVKEFWPMKLPLFGFALVVPLGLLGIWRSWPFSRIHLLLLLCLLMHCAATTAFHVASRYRLTGIFFLFPFAAQGALDILQTLRLRDRNALARMAGLGTLFCVLVYWPIPVSSRKDGYIATQITVAMNEEERERWDQAERWYRQAVEMDGRSLPAILGLGQSLSRQSKWAEAEQVYREALLSLPGNEDLEAGLSRVLHRSGRSQEALHVLSGTLRRNPRSAAGLYQKGRILMDLGEIGEAEQIFRGLLSGTSASVDGLVSLCQCLVAQGKLDEAKSLCAQASRPGATDPRIEGLQRWLETLTKPGS